MRHLAILAIVVALGGCNGRESQAPAAEGSGVRTVENRADARVAAWRLSAEPVLEISGAAAGFQAPAGAVRVRNGFVVADAGAGEIRFFDTAGTATRTVGRKGRGPGEFQYISWIGTLPGDSLAAWDPLLRRLSVYAPDGTYARDVAVRGLSGFFPSIYGTFADGTLLVSTGVESRDGPVREGQPWRDTIALLRMGGGGEVVDTVARMPGPSRYAVTGAGGTPRTNSVPFGPATSAVVLGNTAYLATGERYEIAVHQPDGNVRMRIARLVPDRPVTAADREAYLANNIQAGGTAEEQRERRRMIEDAPYPRVMSPVVGLAAGAGGNLWVREAQPPATWDRVSHWSVFDADGRWIATVKAPGRFIIDQIGPDWVLGRKTDPDGTEHVRVHRLIKSDAT